jgi:hypothetical protein
VVRKVSDLLVLIKYSSSQNGPETEIHRRIPGQFLKCNNMEQGFKYRIIFADYMVTRYGPSVLLTFRNNGHTTKKCSSPNDTVQFGQRKTLSPFLVAKKDLI